MKLSNIEPSQYLDGRPPGMLFFPLLLYYSHFFDFQNWLHSAIVKQHLCTLIYEHLYNIESFFFQCLQGFLKKLYKSFFGEGGSRTTNLSFTRLTPYHLRHRNLGLLGAKIWLYIDNMHYSWIFPLPYSLLRMEGIPFYFLCAIYIS